MKNKIITGLSITIILFFGFFQSYRLHIIKKHSIELENKIESIERQNRLNLEDLSKRNEELKNAYILQKKANKIKGDTCLDSYVNDDFVKLLRENHNL